MKVVRRAVREIEQQLDEFGEKPNTVFKLLELLKKEKDVERDA